MMLLQRPTTLNFLPHQQSPAHHHQHQRAPSAPVVQHVQPTRTPGLLTLSKPTTTTATTTTNARSKRTPKSKQSPTPAHAHAKATAANNNVAPVDRGRQAKSHRAPPVEAQTEDDPFVDHPSAKPIQRPPIHLASRPSGKLAHRRRASTNLFTNEPPATPTPASKQQQQQSIRPTPPRRANTQSPFRICDDSNDEPPFPRTAPLTQSSKGFPFAPPASPSPPPRKSKKAPRKQQRQDPDPEGIVVGAWSSSEDESSSSSSSAPATPPPVKRSPAPKPALTEADYEKRAYVEWKNNLSMMRYAMPRSHNSPSPESLPPPDF